MCFGAPHESYGAQPSIRIEEENLVWWVPLSSTTSV